MNSVFNTIIFNRHLLINDERGMILIDTGSPISFHQEQLICIYNDDYAVPASYMGITAAYLSEKVGCEIVGLLGMDIISQYTMWINTPDFGSFILFEKTEGNPSFSEVEHFEVMGIPGICMDVNGKNVKLLFDTGAQISYISESCYQNQPVVRTTTDFAPLLNTEYQVDMYNLPATFCQKTFDVEFGAMPKALAQLLETIAVDGIIGYDLIHAFRIVVEKGVVKIPSQQLTQI